jgi:peptidoglycan hydrolase-like protein with peptidoglycan-binding domain
MPATPSAPSFRDIEYVGPTNMDARQLQTALQKAGFNPGAIDGRTGPKTAGALAEFKASMGLPADNVLDMQTFQALKQFGPTGGPTPGVSGINRNTSYPV